MVKYSKPNLGKRTHENQRHEKSFSEAKKPNGLETGMFIIIIIIIIINLIFS
jgi:hypothetical protein